MSVYIELVIIDNYVITYCLAALSHRLLSKTVRKLRCHIAAAVGTVVAVFYPFISDKTALLVVRLALFVALSLILFIKLDRFVLSSLLFLGLTFLFGGAMIGVSFMLTGSVSEAINNNIFAFPPSVIIICTYLCNKIVKKIALSVKMRRDACANVYEFSLSLMGKTKRLRGFMDTGNRFYDSVSGLPVVVVSVNSIGEFFTDENILMMSLGKGEKINKTAHYAHYGVLSAKRQKILLLKAENFVLYFEDKSKMNYDVMVGISLSPIVDTVSYDAILHPSLVVGR